MGFKLKEINCKNYSEYLESFWWKGFKILFFKNCKRIKKITKKFGHPVCEKCNSDNKLQLHHKTYRNLGVETFQDVILLCEKCHTKEHKKRRIYKMSRNLRGKGLSRRETKLILLKEKRKKFKLGI